MEFLRYVLITSKTRGSPKVRNWKIKKANCTYLT